MIEIERGCEVVRFWLSWHFLEEDYTYKFSDTWLHDENVTALKKDTLGSFISATFSQLQQRNWVWLGVEVLSVCGKMSRGFLSKADESRRRHLWRFLDACAGIGGLMEDGVKKVTRRNVKIR